MTFQAFVRRRHFPIRLRRWRFERSSCVVTFRLDYEADVTSARNASFINFLRVKIWTPINLCWYQILVTNWVTDLLSMLLCRSCPCWKTENKDMHGDKRFHILVNLPRHLRYYAKKSEAEKSRKNLPNHFGGEACIWHRFTTKTTTDKSWTHHLHPR